MSHREYLVETHLFPATHNDLPKNRRGSVTYDTEVTAVDDKASSEHVKEARKLSKAAEEILEDTNKEFKKAEKAQAKAYEKVAEANAKTAAAMEKQKRGQELLEMAEHEMKQAGTHLQDQILVNPLRTSHTSIGTGTSTSHPSHTKSGRIHHQQTSVKEVGHDKHGNRWTNAQQRSFDRY
uniref:Uncharacterized protein n=1 Tax=Panagrolaimus superbus TaxID=310955 RepID=A0A914YP39_9BILA